MQSICTDVSLDVRYVVVGLTILYVSYSFTGMQLHNIVLIKHSAGLHSSYVGVGQGAGSVYVIYVYVIYVPLCYSAC